MLVLSFAGSNIICSSVDLQIGKWFKTFHSSLRDFLKLVISQGSGQKKRRDGGRKEGKGVDGVTLNVMKVSYTYKVLRFDIPSKVCLCSWVIWLPLRFLWGILKNKVILGSQVGGEAGLQGF